MARRKGPVDPNADEREEMAHYYKTHPQRHDKVNPNQYKQPIGPKQVDPNQYPVSIGPSHPHAGVDSQQYRQPIGPVHPHSEVNAKQYAKPIGPENPREGMNPNQYAKPIGPRQQTPFDRIRNAGNAAYDAGAQAAATGREIGQNPLIRSMASQSGFSNQSPRRNQRQTNYPDENPNNNGGERIYMTICDSQGNCKQKTIKGGPKKPKRQQGPTWGAGGLGSFGNDPGFL